MGDTSTPVYGVLIRCFHATERSGEDEAMSVWFKRRGAVYAFSPDRVALVVGALVTGLTQIFLD